MPLLPVLFPKMPFSEFQRVRLQSWFSVTLILSKSHLSWKFPQVVQKTWRFFYTSSSWNMPLPLTPQKTNFKMSSLISVKHPLIENPSRLFSCAVKPNGKEDTLMFLIIRHMARCFLCLLVTRTIETKPA